MTIAGRKLGLCLLMGCGLAGAEAGDLPRRGVIGVAVTAAGGAGPVVERVLPGSAGEAVGIRAGDVLQTVDGVAVTSPAVFSREIGRHLGGDKVSIQLVRQGQAMTVTAELRPRPFESSPDAEVLYRSIEVDGARRRVIVTRPKGAGRHPAVVILGGLGCYSLDGELGKPGGYGPILAALARHGFVTMRVEKTGEGDSEGPACTAAAATAELEARGYVVGLRALKGYDFVDAGRVFVFAHSLGPLIGSLVLPQEPVRGFIAAETIGRSWFEYQLENSRRQRPMMGEPLDQVEAAVREEERCAHRFFVEHEPAEEVAKLGEACREMMASYAGVPGPYMQQIGDINLARQWKQVDVPVLVMYGTSDPATSAGESRYLVEIINSFHAGRAEYVEIAGMGHDFGRYASQRQFLQRGHESHEYETKALEVMLAWLDRQMGEAR